MDDESKFVTVEETSEDNLPRYGKPSRKRAEENYRGTLAHRIKDTKQITGYRLARIGEEKSGENVAEDYDFLFTPFSAYNEFGVGITLYFRTMVSLFLVTLLCAFVSLAAIDENRKKCSANDCTGPGCPSPPTAFLQGSVYGATSQSLNINFQGASDIACCCIFFLFSVFAAMTEETAVENADANIQTAQDYTVCVRNPPKDITDPKVYYEFFKKFGDIVYVTVAKRNGELLNAIADKKVIDSKITVLICQKNYAAAEGKPFLTQESLSDFQKKLQPFGFYQTIEFLKGESERLMRKIEGLSQTDFAPYCVFITFNQERHQRACLSSMDVSGFEAWTNAQRNKEAVFENRTLLVKATNEASDFIWENCHVGKFEKNTRFVISYGLSFSVIVIASFIINELARSKSAVVAPIFISFLNAVLPMIIVFFTNSVEIHNEQTNVQRSMLFKLVLVRCMNAGVLIYLTCQHQDMFSSKQLSNIQNILLFDAFFTPFLRAMDIDGWMNRNVFSKSAPTQQAMNSLWQGTDWTLAERYTDLLKTIFVGTFFAVPLPSGLFISAIAIFNTYYVDRYCLFNIWKRPALIGGGLSTVARFFFVLTVWAHVNISRLFFANWPYQLLGSSVSFEKVTCDPVFGCGEDRSFWTDDQKKLVHLYTGACLATFILVVIWAFQHFVWVEIKGFLYGGIAAIEADETDIEFVEVGTIDAFVPCVRRRELADPIICCDISTLPVEHIPIPKGFSDITEDPHVYSVAKPEEFPFLSVEDTASLKSMFSSVLYIPQKPKKKEAAPLPQGWELKNTPEGKPYYVDHSTQTTHWTLPAYLSGVNSSARGPVELHVVGEPTSHTVMPLGWERRKTFTGKKYYVNHNDRTIHWELPEVLVNRLSSRFANP